MITIIVGTNRSNSVSFMVAKYYQMVLKKLEVDSQLLNLADLPHDFAFSALYHNAGKNIVFNKFQKIIDDSEKFIFIIPEYNGSFPGALKTFIDGLRYPDSFAHKKVALVGLSAGVSGNAVGLGHFNEVLSYMNADVLGLRIKLGQIKAYFNGTDFSLEIYTTMLESQARKLITW